MGTRALCCGTIVRSLTIRALLPNNGVVAVINAVPCGLRIRFPDSCHIVGGEEEVDGPLVTCRIEWWIWFRVRFFWHVFFEGSARQRLVY